MTRALRLRRSDGAMDHHGRTQIGWRHRIRALAPVPAVIVLSTCFLPSEPSSKQRVVFGLPAQPAVVAVGATVAPTVTVQADGAWLSAPRIRFESLDTAIVAVDSTGQLSARRRGVAMIRAVLVSGATGVTPPETTFAMRVIIEGMTLAKTADSLHALGDTLLFRPGYLDANGWALSAADSAAILPSYQIVSAGVAVQLDAATGAIVAQANGVDTVRATVDTSRITLVVHVRQRAARVAATPADSFRFRALTAAQQFGVTAWDRRDSLIAQPVAAWSSSNPAVVSIASGSGLATAAGNGKAFVIAAVDSVADTVVVTVSQVPTQLAFTAQPGAAAAGAAIAPAMQVAIRDSLGNTVAGATPLVTVAIGTNPGGGTLAGTVGKSAVGGIATFSDLSVDKAASGYTLTASAGGLGGAITVGFDITPGSASQLGFSVPPSTATAGTAIAPAILVTVQDAFGNTVGSAGVAVTIAIGTNPGGGTLAGAATRTAVNGIATFSDASIDKAGTGYTLTAAATGLAGAASAPFNITPGLATQLAFTVQPTAARAGTTIAPAVQVAVQDQLGNTVAGGVAAATSGPFDIAAGAAARVAFTVQPGPTVVGATITPAVQAAIQDTLGNTVTTATNLIT